MFRNRMPQMQDNIYCESFLFQYPTHTGEIFGAMAWESLIHLKLHIAHLMQRQTDPSCLPFPNMTGSAGVACQRAMLIRMVSSNTEYSSGWPVPTRDSPQGGKYHHVMVLMVTSANMQCPLGRTVPTRDSLQGGQCRHGRPFNAASSNTLCLHGLT